MTKNLVLSGLILISFGSIAPLSAFAESMGAKVVVYLDVNDVNDSPKLVEWGKTAKVLIEQWHQRTVNLIPTKGFDVPTEVWLKIRKSNRGIAGTSGGHITVSSGWIEKHPEDIGLVFHELVHVIQDYKGIDAGWLTEGIADYLRWAIYEGKPQDWFPFTDKPQGYKDSYRVAGGFLLWLETDACPGIVNKLNTRIRKRTYKDETFFEKETGRTLDTLWTDYIKDRKKT
jgi:hypothetical protein